MALMNINDGMQRLDIRRNNIPDRDPGRPVSMAMAPNSLPYQMGHSESTPNIYKAPVIHSRTESAPVLLDQKDAGSPVHLRSKSDTTTPIISPYKSNISLFGQPPHLSIINNRPPISRPKSQYDLPNSSHPPTHVGSSHHMLDTSPYKNYQRHPAPQPPQRPVSQYDVPRQSSSLSSTVVPLLLQPKETNVYRPESTKNWEGPPTVQDLVDHRSTKLKDDYREDYRRRGHPVQRTEAVDELKNAFDLAERSCSGITDDLLTGVISRLATTATVSEVEIRRAIDKVKRLLLDDLLQDVVRSCIVYCGELVLTTAEGDASIASGLMSLRVTFLAEEERDIYCSVLGQRRKKME
uniref:Uncharacterized protein n=1 Tax=Magallana gigas TaxID=29159 RepID=K1QD66_MAGGI